MKTPTRFIALFLLMVAAVFAADKTKPLKVLLVTGGGFHDFTAQSKTLSEELPKRVNVELKVVQEGTTREHRMSIYENADWAKGYDVIIHNECFGMVADPTFTDRIAAPHKAGVPAVILHASVHSYRNAPTDEWRQVIGQKSMSHEKRRDLVVKSVMPDHPVMKGFPATWNDPQDELYKIEKTWPNVIPLAKSYGEETKQDHVVIWLNTYGKGRVFTTTLGHLDETMKTDVYLDLVVRGLLWTCGKLGDDGKPLPGYGPGGK
jgi:type 1 glutamine amidotransferase